MARIRVNEKGFSKKFQKSLENDLKMRTDRGRERWKRPAIDFLKKSIDEELELGFSPVENGGYQTGGRRRFQKYSDSYKKQIKSGKLDSNKRITPVNLKVTGKMRRSLKGRPTKGGVVLWYTSPIAKYHNDRDQGAGPSKVIRQIFPETGQRLTKKIRIELQKIFVDKTSR